MSEYVTIINLVTKLNATFESFTNACNNIETYMDNPGQIVGIIIGVTVLTSTMTVVLTSTMITCVFKKKTTVDNVV